MGYNQPTTILVRVPPGTPNAQTGPNGETVLRIPLDVVERTPMQRFMGYMDNIIGARTQIYYDSAVLVAGTALTQGKKVSLFKDGLDEDSDIWNTGVSFQKTKLHTNMVENGQFEFGVTAIVMALELLFMAPPARPAGVTVGIVTDSLDHGTQVAGYNAPQYAMALLTQNNWTFRKGSDVSEENGLLIDLPSNAGLSASFGAQANTAIVQNSMGSQSARVLEYPKVLHSKENFQIDLEALATTFAIPIDTILRFRMICKRLRSA